MNLLAESQQIAQRGIDRGLIRLPVRSDIDRLHGKVRRLAKQQLRRLDLRDRGLTTRRTPRVNRHFPKLAGLPPKEWRNTWLRLRTKEIAHRGLTTRGTVRKNKFTPRFRKTP